MSSPSFDTPLALPCGATLKNRFLKSSMSEQLGDRARDPTSGLAVLYRTWAEGGTGLQVTGNVMIDRGALGEPGNVVLDEGSDLAAFERCAEAARRDGTHAFVQLNHPGKQSPRFLSKEPVAPSAIPLRGRVAAGFHPPRALREDEIERIVARFATAARLAQRAGFTGVQIHGAHGYLVSQFLSPRHNQRADRWGGSAEGRRRFVMEVYRAIRAEVGRTFPVCIKLNSADFLRDGLGEDESMAVVDALAEEGIDLIEISGGTYEAPAMMGAMSSRTARREAYFLEYAEKVRARTRTRVPLAVTGGFRSGSAMSEALRSGATDLVGMARPLAVYPDFPRRLLADAAAAVTLERPSTGVAAIDLLAMLDVTWYEAQLERLSRGKPAQPDLGAWWAVAQVARRIGLHAFSPLRA
jgi:2,4-dienoyl-CoA reductase-like NADH-dependent reductase (Old Yellow Enzyme family)